MVDTSSAGGKLPGGSLHAAVIALFTAVGLLGLWFVRAAWPQLPPLGLVGWAPVIIGCATAVGFVTLCIGTTRHKPIKPMATLFPGLTCTMLAGVAWALSTPGALRLAREATEASSTTLWTLHLSWPVEQALAGGFGLVQAQAFLCLLWAGVAFANAAVAADAMTDPGPGARTYTAWAVLPGVVGAMAAALLFMDRYQGLTPSAEQASTGIVDLLARANQPSGYALLAPMLAAFGALIVLPLILRRLAGEEGQLTTGQLQRLAGLRGQGAAGLLGAAMTFAGAGWVGAAHLTLASMARLLGDDAADRLAHLTETANQLDPAGVYQAAPNVALVAVAAAAIAAVPLVLAAARGGNAPLILPAAAVAAAVVALTGQQVGAWQIHHRFGAPCDGDCVPRDSPVAVAALDRLPAAHQRYRAPCGVSCGLFVAGDGLDLAQVTTTGCIELEVAHAVVIGAERFEVDGADLGTHSEPLTSPPANLMLPGVLRSLAEGQRQVDLRAPVDIPADRILVVVDDGAPMAVVDQVLDAARDAGFTDPLFIVAYPTDRDLGCVQAVELDPPPPTPTPRVTDPRVQELLGVQAPPAPPADPVWRVTVGPAEIQVSTSDGSTATVASVGDLASRSTQVLAGSRRPPQLWLGWTPDAEWGVVMATYEATLTTGVFEGIYLAPAVDEPAGDSLSEPEQATDLDQPDEQPPEPGDTDDPAGQP